MTDEHKEKKLTDEDVAKAILQSIEYSKTITYFDEWGNCKSIMVTDILNLIHRLQSENERLSLIAGIVNKGVAVEIVNMQETIDKQKAEIERLTAEINQRREMMSRMDCNYATELQKNAELQTQVKSLTEENKELHNDNTTLIAGSILQKEQVEKETAKEILQELSDFVDFETFRQGYELTKVKRKLKEIAKQKA